MKLRGSVNRGRIIVKTYTKSTCSHVYAQPLSAEHMLDVAKTKITMHALIDLYKTSYTLSGSSVWRYLPPKMNIRRSVCGKPAQDSDFFRFFYYFFKLFFIAIEFVLPVLY